MNISYRWLRSLAPSIEGTPEEIAERLGMLGAPVDELVPLGTELQDVVIARVEEVHQHPNADRLRLCMVAAGGTPLQVVCGAPNVEPGGYYPFAPVGARLPGGVEIRKAKLRGEVSEGMLCSARELGLGKDHTGIMTLAGEWEPGSSFVESLELSDHRLVLDITPNRPDLLSHIGVARELAPKGAADLQSPEFPGSPGASLETLVGEAEAASDRVRVTIEATKECPRYLAAVIEGVEVGPSPEWLAARLRSIELRPINNVVDATNYVLHELGQPLHAFDLDELAGPEIRVRLSRSGETLRTLDGIDRSLAEGALVIADAAKPIALAGVMGGEESEVGPETTRILLECALFDPQSVRSTARAYGLSTDASHRFERGVDPAGPLRALERVVNLILATAGGSLAPPVLDVEPSPYQPRAVPIRPERVKGVLGVAIGSDEISELLAPIGFSGEETDGVLQVEVPSYRPDVTREIDVIEEIARRRGYDSFTTELRAYRPGVVPGDPLLRYQAEIHRFFERWGMLEARTAAFAAAAPERVPILNPLSSEESHLRDDLAHGLIRRLEYNWARGVRSVRLYEIGTVFASVPQGLPAEEVRVAAIFTGPRAPQHWSEESPAFDLWDLKGLAGEIASLSNLRVVPVEGADLPSPVLAPGEAFRLLEQDGDTAGWAGRVVSDKLDSPAWAEPVWIIEARLTAPDRSKTVRFAPLPAYPAVERDLALVLEPSLTVARVEEVIRLHAGVSLELVRPFDLYVGEGIPEGARSVAWRLRFRSPERTLTDAEVDAAMDRIVEALRTELRVERR